MRTLRILCGILPIILFVNTDAYSARPTQNNSTQQTTKRDSNDNSRPTAPRTTQNQTTYQTTKRDSNTNSRTISSRTTQNRTVAPSRGGGGGGLYPRQNVTQLLRVPLQIQ
ncbi:MAG: hypothetical protein IKW67_03340 [Alphaproteobacteria bacterium]|nr:hypothetical protein [Alphaproteobacteria bacterium]